MRYSYLNVGEMAALLWNMSLRLSYTDEKEVLN